MIKIKLNDIVIGEAEELKPTEKIRFDEIKITDRLSITNKKDYVLDNFIFEDNNSNVYELKNAWVSNVSYDYENDDIIKVEEISIEKENKLI